MQDGKSSGHGCTIIWMCLVPLNCILKNGLDGKYYMYYTIIEKKNKEKAIPRNLKYILDAREMVRYFKAGEWNGQIL